MIHQPDLADQTATRLESSAIPQLEISAATLKSQGWRPRSKMAVAELAFRTLVAFRSHPHINNVLTHISGGDWGKVDRTLRHIFGPTTKQAELSPLARNILDLICAERGVTGRIMQPYFRAFLRSQVEPALAARTIWRLNALYLGVDEETLEALDALTTSTSG